MIRNKKTYAQEIAKEAVKELSKITKPRRAAYDILVEMSYSLLRETAQEQDVRDRWNTLRYGAYDIVRQTMEEPLSRLMRQISPDLVGDNGSTPRRITRDVKFSGKTKIVKIEVGKEVVYPKGGTV
jgi:hypothetical protein